MPAPTPIVIDGLPTLTINALNPYSGAVDQVNDLIPIYQKSSGSTVNVSLQTYLNVASQPLGSTDTQNVSNKTISASTLTAPVINGNITGTYTLAGTPTFPASVVTLIGSQTLTNKTLTSPIINSPSITNATITSDVYSGYTVSNTGSFYGIPVNLGAISSSSGIGAGIIFPSALISGASSSSWAMQSWSPTFTGLTVGNGTLTAKYVQTGKVVYCRLALVLGSTSAVTGDITATLPITSITYPGTANIPSFGTIQMLNSGTIYAGYVGWASTTTVKLRVFATGTNSNQITTASSTIPFTWTTGSELHTSFSYEAA